MTLKAPTDKETIERFQAVKHHFGVQEDESALGLLITQAYDKLNNRDIQTEGEMIPVQVRLYEPYVQFAKDYLAFFGDKDGLELFCMHMIYDGLERLYRDLTEFVRDKDSPHFIQGMEWYEKYSHVAGMSDQPEDKDDC